MTLDPTTPLDTHEQCVSRVDMHCHSTASQVSKLGVQRAAGLPECATPPEEVYELAKRRGMDFVTITDHDTIDGVMQIADRPDVFVSEELTASFRGEPAMAVHVLCYDITPDDHDWLQANAHDVELCAAYMYERDIACALAHPYYIVGAPLHPRHRRRLAELFGVWEVRNGARAPELNRPAATYVATRDGIGIGGSDDHAGVDIGRTYTESPPACTPQEFLDAHARRPRHRARGAGQRRQVGPRRDRTRRALAGPRTFEPDPDPDQPGSPARDDDGAPAAARGRCASGRHRQRRHSLARGRPLPAACLAGRRRARPPGCTRIDRIHAGRRFQPRRPVPARVPPARAQAALRRRAGIARRAWRGRGAGRRGGPVRGLHRRDPLRAGHRVPGQ